MAFTDIDIANAASLEVGMNPVDSLVGNDQTEAIVFNANYATILDNELTTYPWRFCKKQVQLARVAADPQVEWETIWQLPPDAEYLKALRLKDTDTLLNWDRYEDKIYSNAGINDEVVLEYCKKTLEQTWPGYFRRLMVLRMAAIFATGIKEDAAMGDLKDTAAERQMRVARHADAAQGTTSYVRARRITNTRRGRHRGQ